MAILNTGTNSGSGFSSGEQVTAAKLNNAINAGKFVDSAGNAVTPTGNGTCTTNQGLEVSSTTGQLQIKNGNIAFEKLSTTPTTDLAALTATGYYGIINAIYPVGSIYMSYTNSGDPDDILFGGFNHTTWVRIEGEVLVGYNNTSGTFNHAPNSANGTGGVEEVTLTHEQSGLPAHNHIEQMTGANGSGDGPGPGAGCCSGGPVNSGIYTLQNSTQDASQAHTNLQPYQIVYMWRRTV